MRVWIPVLASIIVSGGATATPQYAVDGVAVGTQLNTGGASYREYKCGPSEQFGGLTWCQRARTEKERGKPYTAGYSLLHAQDGSVVYINRTQDPSFFTSKEAQEEIQRYAHKIGAAPRLMKMPHRSGVTDGIIAVWGEVTLVPLDSESVKILSKGGSPKKGLLIDHLANFARSAKEGLPIYRITGGPGFVWAGSFDQKGRGTLRMAAVDASGLVATAPEAQPASEPEAAAEPQAAAEPESASEPQAMSQPEPATETATAAELAPLPEPQATSTALEPEATSQTAGGVAEPAPQQSDTGPAVEELQSKLASATAAVAQLEKAKSAAEAARRESEQARATEKAKLDKKIAQLEAASAAATYPKTNRWENALYGSIGGLLMVLIGSAFGFFWKQHQARKAAANSNSSSAQPQLDREREPFVFSPEIAIAEDAFGRELQQQVAALNGIKTETAGGNGSQPEATASEVSPSNGEPPVTEPVPDPVVAALNRTEAALADIRAVAKSLQ